MDSMDDELTKHLLILVDISLQFRFNLLGLDLISLINEIVITPK